MFRNKIQKVFVMLNEVEPPETDHIESAAETLISKQSINFNDNAPAQPSKIPVVETVPKRSLTEILTSNSEALLAESVPSEHAGDAPTNDKEFPQHFPKRKIESEIKQNEMKESIENKIGQMEVEHPQKLHPTLTREVPGPSGIGSSLPSSQPSKLLVPNVPEHFKLPGPSGSTTAVSCGSVTVEEKVSQHTQEVFKIQFLEIIFSLEY